MAKIKKESVAKTVTEKPKKEEAVEIVIDPRAAQVTIVPDKIKVFKNQYVRLQARPNAEMKPPFTYKWKKDTADIVGETSPDLVVQISEAKLYKCEVKDSSNPQNTVEGMCDVTMDEDEVGVTPDFKVQYNDYHRCGFTSMDGDFIDYIIRQVSSIPTARADANLSELLITQIKARKNVTSDLLGRNCINLQSALNDCGVVIVTDSNNGYKHEFRPNNKKDAMPTSTGRMVDYWKPTA